MTIVEFLHPLQSGSIKDICLAAMFYDNHYFHKDSITVKELRKLLKNAKIPKTSTLNLAHYISTSTPYVHNKGKQGNKYLWALTDTGISHVRELLNLPSRDIVIENDISSLDNLITTIGDEDLQDYIDEAVNCLKVEAKRACIVFLWSAAVKKIRDEVFTYNISNINTAMLKFEPKAKQIKKVNDLVLIKESTLLLASQELGLFDKNERLVLEDCLNLRNKCGHPGKYKVGLKKVSSFIEDLVGILFN